MLHQVVRKSYGIAFNTLYWLVCDTIAAMSAFIRNEQEIFQSYAFSDKILEKREISSLSNIAELDEVEGSGVPPLLSKKQKSGGAGADIEWDGSGISPDDEDGDVIEGSGAHIDEVGGLGNLPITSATPVYPLNITRTTTHYSSFDIHELGLEPDEEDVAIEEVSATTVTSITVQSWTTTSRRPLQPLTPLIIDQTAPPTVFDEKHNIPFDALLKPGVLAGKCPFVLIISDMLHSNK
uniref:Uncharacterized protein n=1 Tax=Elaeophora elaphi TaxID=1147741 RepID=A0A158Q8D1_9BILA